MLSWSSSKNKTASSVASVIFNETITLNFNDARLNNIAMMTWNITTCEDVYSVLNKSLNPSEYSWKAILHTLLCLRTIVFYGSEIAIDMAITLCPFIYKLQDYNSALVKNKLGFPVGGTDFGGPVRQEAKTLYNILSNDNEIRKARKDARDKQNGLLVPLGDKPPEEKPAHTLQFGAGVTATVGAAYSMQDVPVIPNDIIIISCPLNTSCILLFQGLYDGRPDRYFDSSNDPRRREVSAYPDFSSWTQVVLLCLYFFISLL